MYLTKIVKSKDVKNMDILGDVCEWMFEQVAAKMPEVAESALSHLAATEWHHYLSEKEMLNISKHLINQDGSKGFHWNHDTFIKAVESLGGLKEEKPFYNCYTLTAVGNMVYSDHARSIAEDMGYSTVSEVPNEKMALSCYKKAVELLKDPDNGFRARKYFKHTMYEA